MLLDQLLDIVQHRGRNQEFATALLGGPFVVVLVARGGVAQEFPAFGVGEVFEAEDVGVEAGVVALFGLTVADCLQAGAFVGVGALAVHLGDALGVPCW